MAAPNLLTSTTVTGKTAVANVTTSNTSFLNNASSSGKVYKVNSMLVSNVNGVNSGDITIEFNRSATSYYIAKTITILIDTTLDILNNSIYLEEGDDLKCLASADNTLNIVCSYEEIS
jgi:phage-related protein